MLTKIKENYTFTIYACYIGYITQAIVNNFVPLLFLTFAADYHLSWDKITMITTLNFGVQLLVDFIFAKAADDMGYRRAIVFAHVMAAAGLLGLALFPALLPNPYVGILFSVVLYAIGGGIIEVLISPIVEACPTKKKESAMSLLHSFYCWGHVAVVLLSTLFFVLAGIAHWRWMACLWALVPLCNAVFFLLVPMYTMQEQTGVKPMSVTKMLKQKVFWLLMLLMVCAGASELAMSQWASAFAESALHVSKTMGDLLGPCAFAVAMGSARALYGKYSDRLPLKQMMSGSAVLCIFCYILAVAGSHPVLGLLGCACCGFSVGIFWPGTFSMATWNLPGGGTAMFALMALAGDVGCSGGPTLVGLVANATGGNLRQGLLFAMIFPLLILLGLRGLKGKRQPSSVL